MSRVLEIFDQQLTGYRVKLRDDLHIDPLASRRLATTVFMEVSSISSDNKLKVMDYSPVPIRDRISQIEQSIAFNAICNPTAFAELPGLAYAHTVTLCYVSVVYLAERFFDFVSKVVAPESTAKRCIKYLRNNPVRAFRNALAHGNWLICEDGSGIDFWAKKGSCDNEPMVMWNVSQNDLVFWYSLARSTGYAALLGVLSETEQHRSG